MPLSFLLFYFMICCYNLFWIFPSEKKTSLSFVTIEQMFLSVNLYIEILIMKCVTYNLKFKIVYYSNYNALSIYVYICIWYISYDILTYALHQSNSIITDKNWNISKLNFQVFHTSKTSSDKWVNLIIKNPIKCCIGINRLQSLIYFMITQQKFI